MIIEIEERTLENMKEDMNSYIELLSRYDQTLKIKNQLIDGYEKELAKSKEIILLLIDHLLSKRLKKEEKAKIQEIKAILLQDELTNKA